MTMHIEVCPACDADVYVCDECKFETTKQAEADDHECET